MGCIDNFKMFELEEKTKKLVFHLLGHQEKKLRASSLQEKLRGLEAEEIAGILNLICTQASIKNPPYVKAYNALPELLPSLALSREKILQLREVALQKDYFEVLQMLIDLPPKKTPPSNLEIPQDPMLKDLTLGVRISLTKNRQMGVLKKLLKEQDPSIIRSLLLNPRLTETEVLKIASLRPTSARVLEEVFRNPKWIARYRVKKALACNPYCPPPIALHLLKFLLLRDLQEIAQDENLHLAVQQVAHQLLRDKT